MGLLDLPVLVERHWVIRRPFFFEQRRACEVESGMAPDGIVEPVDVSANGLVGFLASVKNGSPDELGFRSFQTSIGCAEPALARYQEQQVWGAILFAASAAAA
jgi:hypothetical protein